MMLKLRQIDIDRRQGGSAMILVVVVTVLLAVVGVMFVMVARVGEMESAAVIDNQDLDAAVDTVVTRIHAVLVEDLFGTDGKVLSGSDDPDVPGPDERWDYAEHTIRSLFRDWAESIRVGPNPGIGDDKWLPGTLDDIWLASLEPVWFGDNGTSDDLTDDIFIWPQITDLWGSLQGRPDSLYHQRFIVTQHPFFTGNSGARWVDPPDENLMGINWGVGLNQVNWERYGVSAYRVYPKLITPGSRTGVILDNADGTDQVHFFPYGARADADGDGVADSRWVKIPGLTTSRGKPVFAAVRIIDNGAMLNLNTAYGFYQMPSSSDPRHWHSKPWYRYVHPTNPGTNDPYLISNYGESLGDILGEANATPFFRAYDRNRVERLHRARNPLLTITTPTDFHNTVIMNIESAGGDFTLFGIDDELEMRNRYLISGKAIARFEKRHFDTEGREAVPPTNPYSGTLYYTFDFGRGIMGYDLTAAYQNSRVKGVPFDSMTEWTDKVDTRFFDDERPEPEYADQAFKYDRRHISTFYSFDRPLRSGRYPLLDTEIPSEPLARRRPREAIFRPLDDRPVDLRTLTDPANPDRITAATTQAKKNLLHLLYAFRAANLPADFAAMTNEPQRREILNKAAVKAAQIVANLIDYLDADDVPTVIDRAFVRQLIRDVSVSDPEVGGEIDIGASVPAIPLLLSRYEFGLGIEEPSVVYGYERQPFISEVYCQYVPASGGSQAFAVELINPYDQPLDLEDWQIRLGAAAYPLTGRTIPAAAGDTLGRLTLWAINLGGYNVVVTENEQSLSVFTPGLGIGAVILGSTLYLERQDPAAAGTYLTVDSVGPSLLMQLVGNNVIHSIKRDDTQWRFANADAYQVIRYASPADSTLGKENGVPLPNMRSAQLPVADNNRSVKRLADFIKPVFIGSQKGGTNPQTITRRIAVAFDPLDLSRPGESAVRLDVAAEPELLDYIGFLNRPQGTLPGRINVNTAAKHVIAAAIPPQLVMASSADPNSALTFAEQIIANRPYERISDLLTKIPRFQKYRDHSTVNVGDSAIRGDIEERDWILARLANIFTVRSDTFTAWILVRLGHDGPERRMLAIFDRSQCRTPEDRPRLVALHPVPDPR